MKPSTSKALWDKVGGIGAGGPGALEQSPLSQTLTHIRGQELLRVIDGGYGHLSLGHEGIVVGVVGDEQHVCPGRGRAEHKGERKGTQRGRSQGDTGRAGREESQYRSKECLKEMKKWGKGRKKKWESQRKGRGERGNNLWRKRTHRAEKRNRVEKEWKGKQRRNTQGPAGEGRDLGRLRSRGGLGSKGEKARPQRLLPHPQAWRGQ